MRTTKAKLILFTLMAVFLVSFARVQSVEAAEVTNTYALTLSTGSTGTKLSNFQYIAVHYQDTSGVERTHYLLPDGAEERSKAILNGLVPDQTIRKTMEDMIGYSIRYEDQGLFDAYSTSTLYFQPDYEVNSIIGVDFLTKTSDKWSCEGLRVYRVDEVYGTRGYSYISGQTYQEFRGSLLFTTSASSVNTLSWTDFQLLRFGLDSKCTVEAETADIAYDSRNDSEYLVKLDIADEYKAGLESLAAEYQDNKAGLESLQEAEMLKLRIMYKDIYGCRRVISVPVISNVIAYALDMGVDSSDNSPLLGLAGQGESIVLKLRLPDFAELYTASDKSGNVTQQAALYFTCGDKTQLKGLGISQTENSRTKARTEAAKSTKDALTLAGVSMYNVSQTSSDSGSIAAASASIENGLLKVNITGSPIYYHVAATSTGDVISYNGSEASVTMHKYTEGSNLTLTRNYDDMYLIQLVTDTTSLSGTKDGLSVELSYMDLSNVSRVTDAYDVRELTNSYYGYWPSSGSDFAYIKNASSGNTLQFVVTLSNVDYFTGIRVSVDGNDEWQMNGLKIYKLTNLGQRVGEFKDMTIGTVSSHVAYTRAFEGTQVYGAVNMQMLVENGGSKEFSFTSDSMIEVEPFDWSNKKYALTYTEANNDLGFTTGSYTYTVEVNVASDAQATYSDGDSGSKNQFFFRLQFENGSSPYVLANQQMTSDGFRAGQTETFTITTNEDYGSVTAVQIIPEMKNSEDYTYDKLNIDSIRIIQNSKSAMSKTWTVSSVGWIGTEYTDPGEENGLRSQKAIYESELAKTYKVDYTTNVANLLFCLGTGLYKDKDGNAVEQFQGKVEVTVQYVSITGESKSATYDIVKYMYDYIGRTPASDSSGLGGAVSDPDYMFRENHMDRFILPISDVQSITRVDFYPTSSNGTSWQISSLAISEISDQGSRYVSDKDEIIYTGKVTKLCSEAEKINLMVCPKGTKQEGVKVNMTENKLVLDSDSTRWVSVVTREPISTRDKLNVYLYMKGDANDKSTYDLQIAVEYTNISGMTVKSTERIMDKDSSSAENMFYIQGLEVKEMSTLDNLAIETSSDRLSYTPIDYAMVQRVRSGVIIDTYYVYFGGADPGTTNTVVKAGPSSASQSTGEYQVVTLDFDSSTPNTQLVAENRDIAVAIRYISSAGNVAGTETEYTSSYIFLTDQQYKTLYSGQSVDITFHEKYVKNITGVILVPTGQVSADITGAVVATYQQSGTDTAADTTQTAVPTGWYSFPGTRHIEVNQGSNTGTINLTDPVVSKDTTDMTNVVVPVTMTIKTAGAAQDYESGTAAPIRMNLYYTGADGQALVYSVEDITKQTITGSSFATDGTATLKFMLTGVKSLSYVTFEPYDDDADNIAAWTPENITIQLQTVAETRTISREVNRRLYEGMAEASRITLANVVVSATVAVREAGAAEYSTTYNTLNEDVNLLLSDGQGIQILPVVNGSTQGFGYKLERLGTDSTSAVRIPLSTANGITLDANNYLTLETGALSAGNYQLTVYALEDGKLNTVVKFTIETAENTVTDSDGTKDNTQKSETEESTETTETEETGESTETTETGESGGSTESVAETATTSESEQTVESASGSQASSSEAAEAASDE